MPFSESDSRNRQLAIRDHSCHSLQYPCPPPLRHPHPHVHNCTPPPPRSQRQFQRLLPFSISLVLLQMVTHRLLGSSSHKSRLITPSLRIWRTLTRLCQRHPTWETLRFWKRLLPDYFNPHQTPHQPQPTLVNDLAVHPMIQINNSSSPIGSTYPTTSSGHASSSFNFNTPPLPSGNLD
jgi:hypothetical protein